MNELGIALVWLFVQVTAVALAGLGLSALLARRAPGAGAPAALTALVASVVLVALAFGPLPAWWAWEATVAHAVPEAATDGPVLPTSQGDGASPGDGLQLAALLAQLRSLGRGPAATDTASAGPWTWPACVAAIVTAGAACGLTRLLLGLWSVRRVGRRSRPVTDAELLGQVAELSETLGVRRAVAVRESAELATAATVGWWWPLILLPVDWRTWSSAQRRAAIAHELAHVQRGDFAAWLLARLSVAVHFWHPLVRALAGRLQLQQELAADALAARLTGSRPAYLRALAELALRADGRADRWPARWPAPAFLSRRETLLRRIAMLRVTDDRSQRPARPWIGRLALVLVCGCTLLASAWRFPAHAATDDAPAAQAIAPFDPALVATDDCDGIVGFRPAAILNRRAMAPAAKVIDKQIDTLTAAFKAGGFGIHIEDIDQVMGRVTFGGEKQPGKRQVMMSLNVLRTTRDIDWVKLRDQCGDLFKKHEWKGDTYVSFPMLEALKMITGGKGDMYLWAADARTLVFDSDKIIKAHIERQASGKKLPLPAYAAGWDKVSRGLFAIALDNRGGRLAKRCLTDEELKDAQADPTKPESHGVRIFQNVSHLVAGCAGDDDFRFDLHASAENAEAAAKLAEHCKALVALARAEGGAVRARATEDTAEALGAALLLKAADSATVRHNSTTVTVHAEVAAGLNALLAAHVKELTSEK